MKTLKICILLLILSSCKEHHLLKEGTVEKMFYGTTCHCWLVKISGNYAYSKTKPNLVEGEKILYDADYPLTFLKIKK